MSHTSSVTDHSGSGLIPRATITVLFIAFIINMIPHYGNVAPWLVVLSIAVAVWRLGVFKGWLSYPGRVLKTLVVVGAVAGFYITYRHQFSVESAVAFFVLTVSLKLIEVRFVKDCYLFVFLLLYLCASQFLFAQSFLVTLYQMMALLCALAVLFSLHKGALKISLRSRIVSLLKMLTFAVPLVIVIFLLFPRIAPLWSIPLSTGKAYTGMTDTMTPGDIAELTQSSARAFRVSFDGEIPAQHQLYWRGLELDRLEGNTWRSTEFLSGRRVGQLDVGSLIPISGDKSYTILMEPTNRQWAYALEGAELGTSNIYFNDSGFVRFNTNVIQPTRYRLGYSSGSLESPALEDARPMRAADLSKYLQLPNSGNPLTRDFILQLQAQHTTSSALVDSVMSYFRTQPFHYTLRPPTTTAQFFDDFLFTTQRGFCAHYAGSMVYMLRLAGIPSRVVVGYQGGEINTDENYLIVHQYDAHAWVEVWFEGKGWVRYDPTAMVSPDRVEKGLSEAVKEEGSFLSDSVLASARYNHVELIRWMRLRVDALNYNWQRWVVGYDGQTQQNILSQWLGQVTFQSLAVLMAIIGGVVVTIAFFMLGGGEKRVHVDKVVLEFERFCKSVEAMGVKIGVGETPKQFAARLVTIYPQQETMLTHYINCFNLLQYGSAVTNERKKALMTKNMRAQAKRIVTAMRKSRREAGC